MNELALVGTLIVAIVVLAAAAIFITLSRRSKSASLDLQFAGSHLKIDTNQLEASQTQIETRNRSEIFFADTQFGFSFRRPHRAAWSGPRVLRGIAEVRDDKGLVVRPEALQQIDLLQSIMPFGQMYKNVTAFRMNTERSLRIELTERTTNNDIEFVMEQIQRMAVEEGNILTDEHVEQIRRELFPQAVTQTEYRNEFVVFVFDKRLLPDPDSLPIAKMALTYLINANMVGDVKKIDVVESNIVITVTGSARNVVVNGRESDVRVDRMIFFTQSRTFPYAVEIAFCHQTMEPLEVWQDLQEMLSSFRIVTS